VPASAYAVELARAFGGCITATSANLSGAAPTNDPSIVARTLAERIDYVLDGGLSPGGPPSTIVDLRGAPRLVRAGAVPWERVLESLE
jgi:L-threonylcarbamoyladenylate synthase